MISFSHCLNFKGGGCVKAKSDNAVVQYLKFIGVGLINAAVNYISYSAVIYLGGHYVLANIVGFTLSVLSSYLINGKFVFDRDEGVKGWHVLLRLYVSYAFTGLLLTNVMSWLWLDVLKLEEGVRPFNEMLAQSGVELTDRKLAEYIAPCINIAITTPLNFVINKFWAYRKVGKSAKKENMQTGCDQ